MTDCISSFSGQYRFLSNFFIEPDGTHVEGEYQASKCMKALDRNRFIGLPPVACKKLGRRIALRADWEDVKLDVMHQLVLKKFQDHVELWVALKATGSRTLIEGNYWRDTFWGQCPVGIGSNHLGRILMEVRSEL